MPYKNKEKQKQAQHESYLRNRDTIISRGKSRRKERKEWFRHLTKGHECIKCGENNPVCLCYHHRKGTIKKDTIAAMLHEFRSKEIIIEELKKCDCLCHNCHAKLHYS